MESKKKTRKLPARKTKNQSETSDSDISYTESDDDDDESTDTDAISSDDPERNLLDEFDFDYMEDVVKLLEEHAVVNMENSIVINRKLQDMLEAMRNKINSMIYKCREIYQENQEKLANPSMVASSLKGIGSCGSPFFKDKRGRSCPPNADYKYRSEVEKELFPSDLQLYPHFTWTAKDKVGILQGIKEQAIEYIERKNSYEQKLNSTNSAINKKVKLHTLKLKKLLEKVDSDFVIDWNQISVYNLGSRHTANSCFASWNAYLRPEINRNEWTEKENIKLNELAKQYKFQDWISIASEMPGRSDYQCFVQYQTVVSVQMREDKGERWTKAEDELLLSLIEENSMGNVIRWNPICSQLPNRTKKQCFARWKYGINPNISRAKFTSEEDCVILAAVEEFGENFNCFPKDLFPNRTVVQIRNRYNNSIKSRGTIRHWSPEDDHLLLDLVAKYGEHDWTNISKSIQSHTRISCRTRYYTISKFFQDNPNATVEEIPRKKRRTRTNVTKSNWVETITGLQNGEKINIEPVNKDLYRSKLRNNELQWYNFLKYSYDFKFGEGYCSVPRSVQSLEFVRHVFECKLNMPILLQDRYAKGFISVTLQKLVRLHDQNDATLLFERPAVGYKLPPNYSTLLAFRGLCIQASFSSKEDTVVSDENELPANSRKARNKFHQRLFSLLYKTTLLSRLEPLTSVEHNTFRVIFDANTQLGQLTAINLAELKVAQTNKIAENLLIAQNKADKNRKYKEKLKQKASLREELDKEIETISNTDITPEVIKKQPSIKQPIVYRNTKNDDIKKTQTQKDSELLTIAKEKMDKRRQHEETDITTEVIKKQPIMSYANKKVQVINKAQAKKVSDILTIVKQKAEERRKYKDIIIEYDENSSESNSSNQTDKEMPIKLDNCVESNEETTVLLELPSLTIEEESPIYEKLEDIDSFEIKHFPEHKTNATQKLKRKRSFEESLIVESSSQSGTFESPIATKIIKYEKE